MDRLPVFVRLSISEASQVSEGQGALKAEVAPTTRKRFHERVGVHWIFLVICIGQGFSRRGPLDPGVPSEMSYSEHFNYRFIDEEKSVYLTYK